MEEQEILNEVQVSLDFLYLELGKDSLSYTLHEKVVNTIMCLQQQRSLLADLQLQSPNVSNRAKRREALNRLEECIHDARWILPTGPWVSDKDKSSTTTAAPVEAIPPFKLFYSYAEEDERRLQGLNQHLSALKNEGYIKEWNKGKLVPGVYKKEETDKQFWAADVILLLISANYLASDTEYAEMEQALTRQKDGVIVIPILLRPVDLPEILSSLKTLPGNGKAVTEWRVRDKAYTHIAQGLREAIVKLRVQRGAVSNQVVVESSTVMEPDHHVPTTPHKNSQSTSNSVTEARHCDALLVTAKLEETKEILAAAQQITKLPPKREFSKVGAYFDLHAINGTSTFLVQSEMGAGEPGGAILTVQEAIQFLSPSAVILIGIAFGMKPKQERLGDQKLGDILVSRQLLAYELQRVGEDKEGHEIIRPRGSRPLASVRLLAVVRNSVADWIEPPAVHFGLILSGEKMASNYEFREKLRQLEPEAIGGEMEGAGLYAAAERNHVDWIVIKAVSDWGDGQKKYRERQRQQAAAQNATKFVMHVLQQGGLGNHS